jgi:hypothetical protein
MNLLDETLEDMRVAQQSPETVAWVGDGKELAISWDAFIAIASDTVYNESYGSAEIAGDLVVLFIDGTWLERAEYDGSEWWDHKKTPTLTYAASFKNVLATNYEHSLAEMNGTNNNEY